MRLFYCPKCHDLVEIPGAPRDPECRECGARLEACDRDIEMRRPRDAHEARRS